MFEQFTPTTKAEWRAKVDKDLKGKPYEELLWQINQDLSIEPMYVREELVTANAPFGDSNDWAICELIEHDDHKIANQMALEALMGGANALEIVIDYGVSANELDTILKDIELPYIATHFFYVGKKISGAQKKLEHFYHLAKAKGYDTNALIGSLQIAPLGHSPNWVNVAKLVVWSHEHLPNFKICTINGAEFSPDDSDVADTLAKIIARANAALQGLIAAGVDINIAKDTIQFQISVGKSYFINIAKIRALKLLWLNVLKGYGITVSKMNPIKAILSSLDYDDNEHTNMIRATSMALSAAVSGVTTLTVRPADKGEDTATSRRIARNVQHLLKMESYIDKVADPAAGTYYIEYLTEEIAQLAWKKFQAQQLI